jgi:hypothetical protein
VKQTTTYVGIDAHKKDLFVAMLLGQQKTSLTWQLANDRRRCAAWCGSLSAPPSNDRGLRWTRRSKNDPFAARKVDHLRA